MSDKIEVEETDKPVPKEELQDIIYRLSKINGVQELIIHLTGIVPTENWLINSKIEGAIDNMDFYRILENQKNFMLRMYLKHSMDYSNAIFYIGFDQLVETIGDELEKREWKRIKRSIRDVENYDN